MKKIYSWCVVIIFFFVFSPAARADDESKKDPDAILHFILYIKTHASQMLWPSPKLPTSFFGWSGTGDFTRVLQLSGWRYLKNGNLDTHLLVSLPAEKISMDNFENYAELFLVALKNFFDESMAMQTRGELRDESSVVIPEGEDKIFFQKINALARECYKMVEEQFRTSSPRFIGLAQGIGFFHNEKVLQYVVVLYDDDGMTDFFVTVELPFDVLKLLNAGALKKSVQDALEKTLEFIYNSEKPAERPIFYAREYESFEKTQIFLY